MGRKGKACWTDTRYMSNGSPPPGPSVVIPSGALPGMPQVRDLARAMGVKMSEPELDVAMRQMDKDVRSARPKSQLQLAGVLSLWLARAD